MRTSLRYLRALLFKTEPANQVRPQNDLTEDRDERDEQKTNLRYLCVLLFKTEPANQVRLQNDLTEERDEHEGKDQPSLPPRPSVQNRTANQVHPQNDLTEERDEHDGQKTGLRYLRALLFKTELAN